MLMAGYEQVRWINVSIIQLQTGELNDFTKRISITATLKLPTAIDCDSKITVIVSILTIRDNHVIFHLSSPQR
jgi:hypothetical protein